MTTPSGPPNQPWPGQPGQPSPGQPYYPAQPPPVQRGRKALPLILSAVLIGGFLTVGGLFLAGGFSSGGPTEVRVEPVATIAPDPFTPPVGTGVANLPPPATAVPAVVSGGTPGLYGGTGENRCDKNQLIAFLQQDPAKAAAWAGVLGISPADIPSYINGLAVTVLRTDTAVTNHGFRNGKVTVLQSVLQAGTRVFVDAKGVPVTKCSCGNPLLPAKSISDVSYVFLGQPWPTFSKTSITIIQPAPQPITTIQVTNIHTQTIYQTPVSSITPNVTVTVANYNNNTNAPPPSVVQPPPPPSVVQPPPPPSVVQPPPPPPVVQPPPPPPPSVVQPPPQRVECPPIPDPVNPNRTIYTYTGDTVYDDNGTAYRVESNCSLTPK